MPALIDITEQLRLSLQSPKGGSGPLYSQLSRALRDAVEQGQLKVGQSLPAERDMAELLQLSRVTVRRAIGDLVDAGLLTVKRGAGTFVAGRIEQALSHLGSFTEDMSRRGKTPGSCWIRRDIVLAGPDDWVSLGLSGQDEVVRTERVRTADGEPLAIERARVAALCVGHTAEFGDSLYAAMERHGVRPVRAVQRVRAGLASQEDARLLGIEPGAAVLVTERRSFSREGRPLELTHSVYRGDRYDYVVELRSGTES
jgi:GntR family transcriptional regulator